jgi:hypothetical protein
MQDLNKVVVLYHFVPAALLKNFPKIEHPPNDSRGVF